MCSQCPFRTARSIPKRWILFLFLFAALMLLSVGGLVYIGVLISTFVLVWMLFSLIMVIIFIYMSFMRSLQCVLLFRAWFLCAFRFCYLSYSHSVSAQDQGTLSCCWVRNLFISGLSTIPCQSFSVSTLPILRCLYGFLTCWRKASFWLNPKKSVCWVYGQDIQAPCIPSSISIVILCGARIFKIMP